MRAQNIVVYMDAIQDSLLEHTRITDTTYHATLLFFLALRLIETVRGIQPSIIRAQIELTGKGDFRMGGLIYESIIVCLKYTVERS